jgi:hypothetical protein
VPVRVSCLGRVTRYSYLGQATLLAPGFVRVVIHAGAMVNATPLGRNILLPASSQETRGGNWPLLVLRWQFVCMVDNQKIECRLGGFELKIKLILQGGKQVLSILRVVGNGR